MATQDTPIDAELEQAPIDEPVETVKVTQSNEKNDNLTAIQAAFLENYVDNTPVVDSFFDNVYTGRQYQSAEEFARKKARLDSEDIQEELIANPYGPTGFIEDTVNNAENALRTVEEMDVDQHFAEAAMGEGSTIEEAEEVSGSLKLQKMLNEWQNEIEGSDQAVEVGKYFVIPFLESARGVKLTGEYFGAQDEVKSAIRAFKNLPEEEQVKIFPSLKKELSERIGDVAAVDTLTQFITPGGDEDFDRFGAEEVFWDAADALGVGLAVSWAFRGIAKGANTVKTLRDLKNFEASETASAAAVVNPELRAAMGLDETSATANALPFDTSIEVIEQTGGMSNKVNQKLREFFEEADTVAENISTGQGFLREQAVSNKYRLELENFAKEKFQKEKAENIRITGKSENTTTFEYQVLDEEGNLTDKTYELKFDLNNAGTFEQSTMGLIREFVGSPTAFARGMLREDVKTAERLDYLTARMNRQLSTLTRKALEPIGLLPTPKTKASLAKVDKALLEGDEWKNADGSRGKVFTPDELRTQFGLDNDNEISAYYRINRLYNNLWNIRNGEKRRELDTLGYKNINFSRNGDSSIGKSYENALTASSSINANSIGRLYDAGEDAIIDMKSAPSDIISKAYEDGKTLVRMDEPYDIGDGRGLYRYALVSADEVGELPTQVLARKEGYVPRLYEDAAYFVKEQDKIIVDGDKSFTQHKTLRFFDNKRDADTYRAQLKEQFIATRMDELAEQGLEGEQLERRKKAIEEEAEDKYIRLADREEETLSAASGEASHGQGGLYTGARAQDALLFGLEGDRANRVNSFDALMRNIGNVSRYASINQWRLGLEQRWINTANQIFKDKGIQSRVTKFEKLPQTSETSEEVRFLNRTFDQIRDWQNFPTPEEQFFSNVMRGLYDWAGDHDHKRTARLLGNFRDADPISAARATAFHSLLGFFNPAQLWVQAQGAAMAISIGAGKHLTRSMANTAALTALGNGAVNSNRIGLAAKAARIDKDELTALHELWDKTGYADSVLQTADHAAAAKGYGMTMDAIRRTANAGLLFYRQGEFFNRRLSFSTAVERWKANNTGKSIKDIGNDELKLIMDDANNMMLNMTKANRALWQKGLPSLPTQFLQVTTKFVETATGLNQNFTRAERARLLTGQLALYGAAGVPLVSVGTMIAKEVFGMTQADIDDNPMTVKAINDGIWGVWAMQMFGADIELSSRGSLMRGITDFVDNWFIEESSITEKLLGAFGSTGERFFSTLAGKLRPLSIQNMGELDFENFSSIITAPILASFSTYNNAQKAILMERLDSAYSRSGRVVAEGFSPGEVFMQAIGFQPTQVTETYDLQSRIEANRKFVKNIQNDILKTMNKFAAANPSGEYTEKEWAEYQKDIRILYNVLDPDEQMQTQEFIRRQVTEPSRRDSAISRYIENMKNDTANDLGNIRQTLLGTKLIRIGITAEEEE